MSALVGSNGNARIVLPTLTMIVALQVGMRRYLRGRLGNYRSRAGRVRDETAWRDDMEGSCAECAYAAWRDVFWCPDSPNDRDSGDVAGDYVRSTRWEHGQLIIDQWDAPDARRYVLLVGELDTWRIAGWLFAGEGKQERYERRPGDGKHPAMREGGGGYFIPQSELHHDLAALRRPPLRLDLTNGA
jgi:hypothetical protein